MILFGVGCVEEEPCKSRWRISSAEMTRAFDCWFEVAIVLNFPFTSLAPDNSLFLGDVELIVALQFVDVDFPEWFRRSPFLLVAR